MKGLSDQSYKSVFFCVFYTVSQATWWRTYIAQLSYSKITFFVHFSPPPLSQLQLTSSFHNVFPSCKVLSVLTYLYCKNSRVVMWVKSIHNTLPPCVAAGTWVDARCVVRNAFWMRINSTRLSRVTHGTHFQTRFFFTAQTTTRLMRVLRESWMNTLRAEVHTLGV